MELRIDIPLNKTQKIIFLMVAIVTVSILVFWLFIYNPAKAKMRRLKKELSVIESEIKKIEMVSGGEKNLDVAYEKFHKRYSELENIIPTGERSTLSTLSAEADEMGIEVLSVKPGKLEKSKLPVEIKGKTITQMPISMRIECDYISLGKYLDILRKKIPTLIVVNDINIDRPSGEDIDYLSVSLNLTLYMLIE